MANYDKETIFFFLQMKEDFYDLPTMKWLEKQTNGKEYSLFYTKLCLKSLRTNGLLVQNVGKLELPCTYDYLSEITNTPVDTVVVAMKLLVELGLVEVISTGQYYLPEVEDMIGSKSKGAFKKQQQRIRNSVGQLKKGGRPTLEASKCGKKNTHKGGGQMSTTSSTHCPPTLEDCGGGQMSTLSSTHCPPNCPPQCPLELELELNKELDLEREATNPKNRICAPTLEEVKAYCEERKNNIDAERFINYYSAKGWRLGNDSIKNWKALILNWEKVEKKNEGVTKTYTTEQLNAMFDNLGYDDL